jgi:hypothetical protein
MDKGKQYISKLKIQAISSIVVAVVTLLLPFDFHGLDTVVAISLVGNGIYQWRKSSRSAS